MTPSQQDLQRVDALGRRLSELGWRVATAESCTGGGVAEILSSRAGASEWLAGGVVAYADIIKQRLLGVSPQTLVAEGAVSQAVVVEMAEGALERFDVQLSVAVSGIAGPGGGSAAKPVGTVWFAWCRADREPLAELCYFEGERDSVREQAVRQAILGLNAMLRSTD